MPLPLSYEVVYCGRGRAELYIKNQKLGLTGDRLSCARKEGNAIRLLMSGLAHQLLYGWCWGLAGSELARAAIGEIRQNPLQMAARERMMKTRVDVHLAGRHPGSGRLPRVLEQTLPVVVEPVEPAASR